MMNKKIHSIVPLSKTYLDKSLSIAQLRENQELTTEIILTTIQKKVDQLPKDAHYSTMKIALVGHYNLIDKQVYFSALNVAQTPLLQKKILQIIPEKYLHQINKIEFKYYVCYAYTKLRHYFTQMQEHFTDARCLYKALQITVRASTELIMPNPVFFNVRMKLKPEDNKHKSKYTNKIIPKEYLANEEWLAKVSCLNRRVIANTIPCDFISKHLKTSENVEQIASLFTNDCNLWKTLSF